MKQIVLEDGSPTLNEVKLEEYKRICWNYDIWPGQKICSNGTVKFYNQNYRTNYVNDFKPANDFVNDSLQFDSSPLKVLQLDTTVKLGNVTKLLWFSVALEI